MFIFFGSYSVQKNATSIWPATTILINVSFSLLSNCDCVNKCDDLVNYIQ